MRLTVWIASVVLVVWAALVVPMPYQQTVPGTAHPVEDLVTVAVDSEEVTGDLALLTVRDRDATPVDVILAAFQQGQQLQPIAESLPPGIDDRTMREILAQQFANSFTTAVAVAAERSGYEVELTTEVVATQVLPGSPSDGVLDAGDRILAVAGEEVASATALRDALDGRDDGDQVVLRVERPDGQVEDRTVTLGVLEATGEPGLGILPSTLTEPVELPFDVQLAESNIIGPSAGLMIAVTVVDLLSDEDLARGRIITGTGSIDGTGAIGTIGGIEQKVEAAVDADAAMMLVPQEQAAQATAAADGRVEVVGVATLDDALTALRR